MPIDNLSGYSSAKEAIVSMDSMESIKASKMVFVSSDGFIKLVEGSEFDVSRKTIAATKLADESVRLIQAAVIRDYDYLVLKSADGYFLRMTLKEIPDKKKTAIGVRGMRLNEGEVLDAAYLVAGRVEYIIEYNEKQLSLNKLKLGKRDTRGVKVRM